MNNIVNQYFQSYITSIPIIIFIIFIGYLGSVATGENNKESTIDNIMREKDSIQRIKDIKTFGVGR